MAKKMLKRSTLCLLSMAMTGMSQGVWAESTSAVLPIFKLNDSAEWCDANLHKLQQRISQLEQQSIQPQSTAAPVLAEWDQLMASFEDFSGPISLYSNVHPDAEFRKAADDCEVKINQLQTEIYQNPKLYQRIKNTKTTDPIDRKYRQDILDQFEDTGVQLAPEKRARLKHILDELTKLSQEFSRNVRDNPEKLEFTPAELKGLPESYISALKKNIIWMQPVFQALHSACCLPVFKNSKS